MKTIYKLLFTFIIIMVSLKGAAQNSQYDQVIKITPPSPDAVALGKYGAIPVGLYSGIPQVSIPIYSTKEGDIDVNLSLSYMSGGVKVEDIASLVGLGWTLNASGVITRSVKGLPDDHGRGYLNKTLYDGTRPTQPGVVLSNMVKARLATGIDDGESDVYYFNFANYSGSFYFDTDQKPHFFNHSNLKIVPYITALRLDSFKVVTEKGFEYIFDQKEYQSTSVKTWTQETGEPAAFVPGMQSYVSSWYLSQVRSPNGFIVKYEYDKENTHVYYEMLGSERRYVKKNIPYTISDPSYTKTFVTTNSLLDITNYKRLSKIVLSNGYIEFNAGSKRTDVPGLPTLGDISIFSNKSLRKYSFDYHYYSNRLMLDNIKESNNGLFKSPYRFSYDESKSLPERRSQAQDHWGYYNGHLENKTLIPSFGVGSEYKAGANRNVDTTFNKLGILKKIEYPTTGSTEFQYEPNVAHNINKYPLYEAKKVIQQLFTYPATVEVPNWYTPRLYATDSLTFTVNTMGNAIDDEANGVWADIIMKIPYDYSKGIGFVGSQYELWDITTGVKVLTNADIGNPISSQQYREGNIAYDYKKNAKVFLRKDHTFKLIHFVKPDVYNRFNSFPYYFIIDYYKEESLPGDNIIVGGLRIKNIIDVDPIASKKTKRSYLYTNGLNSTGYLLDYPRYFYNYSDLFTGLESRCDGYFQGFSVNVGYKVALSSSYFPLATTKNAYLGYNQVTEITNDTLKTLYKYTSAADIENQDRYEWNGLHLPVSTSESTINAHPESQYRSFDWKRGLLTEKTDYLYAKSGYTPLRIESHYYSFNNSSELPNYHQAYNYTGAIFQNDWYGYVPRISSCQYKLSPYVSEYPAVISNYYKNDTGYAKEDSTVVKMYDPLDFTKFTVSKVETIYDTLTLQPSQVITKQSNGVIQTIHYKYPTNYDVSIANTNSSSGIRNLVTKNVFNEPVETYVTIQTGTGINFVSGEIKSYRPDLTKVDTIFLLKTSGIVNFEPSSIKNGVFKKSNEYFPKFIYSVYDNRANILESSYFKGASTSYKWGYKQQYPIAKINNALNKDVFFDDFEQGAGNSILGDAKTGNYSRIGGYTKSLNNLTNGLYELSYWKKSDTVWSVINVDNIAITNSTYTISVDPSFQVDDVRFLPMDAQMMTFTYEPLVGMTSQTDAKGLTNYYQYDDMQRLKFVKDQNRNIVNSYNYNYKTPLTIYKSSVQNKTFTKNDCPAGSGSQVILIVPEGAYTSTISIEDANRQAIEDANRNGQINANLKGTCTVDPPVNTCVGVDKKIVNNICETGIRMNTSSTYVSKNNYKCTYHYEWSDGSRSGDYTENNTAECAIW